jgi:hypothetical protein
VTLGSLQARVSVTLAALLLCVACSGTLQTASGVVLQVDGTSLTQINSFVLRTADGQVLTFAVDTVAFDQTSFPPQHLREHQQLASPVKVTYRVDSGKNVAIKLEDAPQN